MSKAPPDMLISQIFPEGHVVLISIAFLPRSTSVHPQPYQIQQEIRTLRLPEKGSDYTGLVRLTGLEPVRSPTRPSNVRVCLFRHNRANTLIILVPAAIVKPHRL